MKNKYKVLKSLISMVLCVVIIMAGVFDCTTTASAGEVTSKVSLETSKKNQTDTKESNKENIASKLDEEENDIAVTKGTNAQENEVTASAQTAAADKKESTIAAATETAAGKEANQTVVDYTAKETVSENVSQNTSSNQSTVNSETKGSVIKEAITEESMTKEPTTKEIEQNSDLTVTQNGLETNIISEPTDKNTVETNSGEIITESQGIQSENKEAVTLIAKDRQNENFTSITEVLKKIDEYSQLENKEIESENDTTNNNSVVNTYTIRFNVPEYELTADDVEAIETTRKVTIVYDGLYKEENGNGYYTTLDLNILDDEGIFFANNTAIQNIKLIYDKENENNTDSDSIANENNGSVKSDSVNNGNVESGSVKSDGVNNGNVESDSVKSDGVKDDSAERDSVKSNSVVDNDNTATEKYLVITANGYKLTIGENVETPANTEIYSGFVGLKEKNEIPLGTQSELVINSGTYESVIAGGSKEQKTSKIVIQDGTINNIYGSGSANLEMTTILVRGGVYCK